MRPNLRNTIYPAIRRSILLGQFAPGHRLNAADLARQFGVSHIPVREAISQLQSDGLVEVRAGQGAFVCAQDVRETDDLFHVRQTLEIEAASLAAKRATPARVEELRKTVHAMQAVTHTIEQRRMLQFDRATLMDFVGEDLTFHRLIARMTSNRKLLAILGDINGIIRVHGLVLAEPSERFLDECRLTVRQHEAVFEAVAAKDSRAAKRAMFEHWRYARRAQIKRLIDPHSVGQWCFPGELLSVLEQLENEDQLLNQPGIIGRQPPPTSAEDTDAVQTGLVQLRSRGKK